MIKRFNLLDFIIITLLLAAVAAGGVLYFTKNDTQAAVQKTTLEFDIQAIDLTEQEAKSIKAQEGSSITYGKANSDIGVIKSVTIEPYKKQTKDLVSGEVRWVTHPTDFQVTITVLKEVTETDDYFKGEKEEIRIGQVMPFLGKGIGVSTGYIVDMREVAK